MISLNNKSLLISSILGILTTIFFILTITLSVHFAPWFNWFDFWISELGGNPGDTPIWLLVV